MENFNLSDFGSIASIISLFVGLVGGFIGGRVSNKSNIQNASFKNVSAGSDVVGRDKK